MLIHNMNKDRVYPHFFWACVCVWAGWGDGGGGDGGMGGVLKRSLYSINLETCRGFSSILSMIKCVNFRVYVYSHVHERRQSS